MQNSLSVYEIGPGRVVAERYEIVRPHRQGGLSVAFEARDLAADGDACELQVFPPSLFDGERELNEFARNWQPWKRVRSERVLAVRDIATVGTTSLVLVTDLPQGAALRSSLASGVRFSAAAVVELGMGILDGLGAIHGLGLVHGDVKPATVWCTDVSAHFDATTATLVLVDGGTTPGLWSAKALGERTALIGTPYYAPVELFGGECPDVQSDVYSAATLLFELATGVQPWAGKTFLEVFQSKLAKEPPRCLDRAPKAAVPTALEHAIRGGLHADRERRYASPLEFRAALEAALEHPGMRAKG